MPQPQFSVSRTKQNMGKHLVNGIMFAAISVVKVSKGFSNYPNCHNVPLHDITRPLRTARCGSRQNPMRVVGEIGGTTRKIFTVITFRRDQDTLVGILELQCFIINGHGKVNHSQSILDFSKGDYFAYNLADSPTPVLISNKPEQSPQSQ